MKIRKSTFMPVVVLAIAVASGGWFLQQGVNREANVYFHVRLLEEVMDHIEGQFVEEVDAETLYQAAIDGVVGELGDPNSQFLKASDYEDVRIRTQGEYGGVGLEVVDRDGFVTVVAPIPGTPGARAGFRPGDRIVEVDGSSIEGWITDQAVELLRGRPGTTVEMGIQRLGVEGIIPFEVTRAVIHVKSVPFAELLPGGVGYIPLQIFNGTTTQEVIAAMDSLSAEGMTSLILDLRDNPGGLLDEGVGLTDLFLDPGQDIVETRGRAAGQSEKFTSRRPQAYPDLPVAVLVKERSASAAEIFAGALQDHDRALLIGGPTFGKGSVQSLFRLSGGNVLKLTTARWFTPSGRSIQKDREDQIAVQTGGAIALAGDAVERPSLADKPEYTSTGGRVLYGGGGIVPDLWVVPDTLTGGEREAVRSIFGAGGGFFIALQNWAVEYLLVHPDLPENFQLSPQDVVDLHEDMVERGSEVTLAQLQEAHRYVEYHMLREVALQRGSDQGQFRRTMSLDLQLQTAVELLRAAESQGALFTAVGTPLSTASSVGGGGSP
ncbi:MAG: S41 family peptidase [Gemmatimonadota bacterium]|nr:S41 family peptidase [Gemmatimonadota bacterium]